MGDAVKKYLPFMAIAEAAEEEFNKERKGKVIEKPQGCIKVKCIGLIQEDWECYCTLSRFKCPHGLR